MRRRQQEKGTAGTETGAERTPVAAVRLADALLVRRVQAGDAHAFAELVGKYQERVFNACLRICGQRDDAADLTQDAFLKAFSAINEFRGASAFYTWIFRIAVNLALSHQRKRRLRTAASLDSGEGDASLAQRLPDGANHDPAAPAVAVETRNAVADALASLDAEHRVAVVLRDIEGCDYQEIADILELPVGTAKSRIFRGRMALRALLAPQVDGVARTRT